jgi:hypothetical protein
MASPINGTDGGAPKRSHHKKPFREPKKPNKTKVRKKSPGRCKHNWEQIEPLYIYGEKAPDAPKTAMPSFPSLLVLAARFGIPPGTVGHYAVVHEWAKKREEAQVIIQENVHRAMLQQLTDQYVPVRAGLGAIVANSLSKIQQTLQGDNLEAARIVGEGLSNVDKALKTMNAIMGIPAPPPVAIQNNLFVQTRDVTEEAEAAPPVHAVLQPSAGSIWSLIASARDSRIDLSPEARSILDAPDTLPGSLSACSNG